MTVDNASSSDRKLLELIRRLRTATIQKLIAEIEVTANAVRQRLQRLMAEGLVQRVTVRRERGRPHHVYRLTESADRLLGDNYTDLAMTLWREIKNIADPAVRRALTRRVCDALVAKYGGEVHGTSLDQRLHGLSQVFSSRGIELEIDTSGPLPIIREHGCPYPDLAAEDRGICSLEKQVFSRVLGSRVRLSQCRLDGHDCCEFETHAEHDKVVVS